MTIQINFVKNKESCGIPYRCLIPLESQNLLIAGRMMSTDTVVHNSTKNTACCRLQARQQEAAALCAQYSVTPADLDVVDLQKVLKKSWSMF